MIRAACRHLTIYGAFAVNMPKVFLAYSAWVWAELVVQLMSMVVFVYFWRAVYAGPQSLSALSLDQTLNYILLAQALTPLILNRNILRIGEMLREGSIALELVRPVDLQGRFYAESLGELVTNLIVKSPLILFALLVFGLQLPSEPLIWLVFFVSLFLGHAVLFCFAWCFNCLAFYTIEVWGLNVLYEGIATFFSGALIPLALMPGWLSHIAFALPFAQALYIPVSLLSGVTPVAETPRVWLIQLCWLAGTLLLSRIVFDGALRRVTVQGG